MTLRRYHVNAAWQTTTGTLASATFTITADDEDRAASIVGRRITTDARRRYRSNLQVSAIMLPEGAENE